MIVGAILYLVIVYTAVSWLGGCLVLVFRRRSRPWQRVAGALGSCALFPIIAALLGETTSVLAIALALLAMAWAAFLAPVFLFSWLGDRLHLGEGWESCTMPLLVVICYIGLLTAMGFALRRLDWF